MRLNTLNTRSSSHPIHRLPLELLEHIFHLLLEIEIEDLTYGSPWHEVFPLNLTQVCNQWKSLAFLVRNRRLWTTVRIDPADPDWLGQLHLYLFMSRDEGLNVHIVEVTQSIVDELAGHHRRIRSLPGLAISQIWHSTASETDTVNVLITDQSGKKPFSIPLSSSVTALPFVYVGEGSLHRLHSFPQLQTLQMRTQLLHLHELGGPLQLPALQRLCLLIIHENLLEFLKLFPSSQLRDLQLELPGPLSPAAYYELETFIIRHMPNLQWIALAVSGYTSSEFSQPVEESTTQSSAAMQSETLRRIDIRTKSSTNSILPFERLIESAPCLEECHFTTSLQPLPCCIHHIRELEFDFHHSPISHAVNGELIKLVHLEVLRLAFATPEQVQLLSLLQAPSLLSLKISYVNRGYLQSSMIPVDVFLTFISTSQGMHKMDLRFPVDSMELSLPELQHLRVTYIRHISVLASFDVPKLQHLFLEIDDGRGEDESIAGDEDLEEDPIAIASHQPSFEAVGGPSVFGMINTKQSFEMGKEAQKRNIPEEAENQAEMNQFKGTDLHGTPSGPVVTSPPIFPVLTFEYLKDFEFVVSTVSSSYPIRVLPYFSDMLTALPALERVTLPVVSFNDSPYIDQLVKKISEIPTLCPNLQEIRTRDYPNEWSSLLKFLRDRKRASLLSDPTIRPIHALHFPITPHGSIVERLQDAMLGKVSLKSFPALCPWPLLIDPAPVHMALSWGEDTTVDSDEETRSQVQGADERTAATPTGNGDDKKEQSEEGRGCDENEDGALPCFYCHKAGLGAGCRRAFWKEGILSRLDVLGGNVLCSKWDLIMRQKSKFEAICLP